MKYLILFLLFPFLSCQIIDSSGDPIIDNQYIIGKWLMLDFDNDLILQPYVYQDSLNAEKYIYYEFIDEVYFNCILISSDKSKNYYKRCRWNFHTNDYESFFTLSYVINDATNTTRSFKYFYKIEELSEETIKLEHIRQIF
jgi:hypothetical protein